MNSDFNPGPVSPNPPENTGDRLAAALEALILGRSSRPGAPPPPPIDQYEHPTQTDPAAGPCPEPSEWARLLDPQILPDKFNKVDELLAHAASCDSCAGLLRAFQADISPEETAAIAGLRTASIEGQRKLAAQLARTSRSAARTTTSRLYLWMGSGLAASLLLGLGLVSWWRQANNPERLLAEAYTHSRIFDLRMPGSGFAEITPGTHLRGGSTGRESSKLLEARAGIEHQLEAAPEDAHWLQLEARSDILEEKYDPAIDILDRLVVAGPATASLLLDDASAYFQRGDATGSENDRANALDLLRRADELAPGDPVILFNEAVVMEDRGQIMNAVETWNRYLRFERDPRWLAEGRSRLAALEQKLNELKSHRGRLEQHLATPQAMRSLATDANTLASIDEELSTTLLPRLLDAAYPQTPAQPTAAQSRGSPCTDDCQSARTLLYSLADSLQRNHQDPWLTQLLPPNPSSTDPKFLQAAHTLAQAISAEVHGDYPSSAEDSQQASQLFHALHNPAGEMRAEAERADALQATANYSGCYAVAHALLTGNAEFAWIQSQAQALQAYCNPAPGSDSEDNPSFVRAQSLAHNSHYALVELRVRNMRGGAAVDSGNAEAAWRDYLATIRQFYAGDYPALRLSGTLSGLEQVEQSTPRSRLALLLQREHVGALELTENRQLLPTAQLNLAAAAIRAGSIAEAQQAITTAQSELAANGGGKSVQSILAEVETALASVYLERRQPEEAGKLLDSAYSHMAGEKNAVYLRNYAVARGQIALEQGHPEAAEPLLRNALLEQERLGAKGGPESIVQAEQNRDLYAILAGVWLAQGRPGDQILALWERYRLRILGIPIAPCPNNALDCLQSKVGNAIKLSGFDLLFGQIVLPDRLLLFRATSQGVVWTQSQVRREDLLAAANRLELAVNSPESSMATADRAARQAGELLIDPINPTTSPNSRLLLEPDPLLGNLPWPSVATAAGPLGLQSNLEEAPSLLLEHPAPSGPISTGNALVVGASVASGDNQVLPEVLQEARAVAQFDTDPSLLLGDQATQPQVAAHLATAAAIHFAGHAARQAGGTRLLLAPQHTSGSSLETPWLDSQLLRKDPPREARLVVFSACSSGKKEAVWNHGMGDIVATLASLGVPDVLATRWQIDSSAAVPMMDAFYSGLSKGFTVPQALTTARQSMVRDPRYRHPYYWAAWYASGTGTANLSPIFHSK